MATPFRISAKDWADFRRIAFESPQMASPEDKETYRRILHALPPGDVQFVVVPDLRPRPVVVLPVGKRGQLVLSWVPA